MKKLIDILSLENYLVGDKNSIRVLSKKDISALKNGKVLMYEENGRRTFFLYNGDQRKEK